MQRETNVALLSHCCGQGEKSVCVWGGAALKTWCVTKSAAVLNAGQILATHKRA